MSNNRNSRRISTIILVGKDEVLLRALDEKLSQAGFDVFRISESNAVLPRVAHHRPDLVIVDLELHHESGLDVCRMIRTHNEWRSIPLILLTDAPGESEKVRGLMAGADSCVTKPISIPILLSQVRALLRGVDRFHYPPPIVRVGDLEIDKKRYVVYRTVGERRVAIQLPRRQFELLHFLAAHPGRVFKREELVRRLWHGEEPLQRTVDVHVRKIRVRIGDEYIETVKGIGYRFRYSSGKHS